LDQELRLMIDRRAKLRYENYDRGNRDDRARDVISPSE